MNMVKLTWGPKVAPFVRNASRLCRLVLCCSTFIFTEVCLKSDWCDYVDYFTQSCLYFFLHYDHRMVLYFQIWTGLFLFFFFCFFFFKRLKRAFFQTGHNHLHLHFIDHLPLASVTAGSSLHLTLPTMLSHGLLRIPVRSPSSELMDHLPLAGVVTGPSLHPTLPTMLSHGLLRIPVRSPSSAVDGPPSTCRHRHRLTGPSLHPTLPTMSSHGLLRIPAPSPSSAVNGPPSTRCRSQSPSDATHDVESQSTKDTSTITFICTFHLLTSLQVPVSIRRYPRCRVTVY